MEAMGTIGNKKPVKFFDTRGTRGTIRKLALKIKIEPIWCYLFMEAMDTRGNKKPEKIIEPERLLIIPHDSGYRH